MLLHTEGAAATCPHQPRLGHNLSGVRGLLRALKSALLLAGAMICAQTMAIKQMLRKFPVNSRLKKLHGPFAYLFGTGGPTCDAKG